VLAGATAAYAFSPIDLIPDLIPLLGYLDDLVIVPLGIFVSIRVIPADVMSECRARAVVVMESGKPVSRTAAAIVVTLWLVLALLLLRPLVGR